MGRGGYRGIKQEGSASTELQTNITREEVKECAAQLKNRKSGWTDEIVNEFLKHGGEVMITMMVML